MPTLEFFGMRAEEREALEQRVRGLLAAEDFREACVFVTGPDSRVLDWHGRSRPFLRVSTRSAQRAARFRELLKQTCDLEIVRIDFQPVADGPSSSSHAPSSPDEGAHSG